VIQSILGMLKKDRHSVTFFCSHIQPSDKACPTQCIFLTAFDLQMDPQAQVGVKSGNHTGQKTSTFHSPQSG